MVEKCANCKYRSLAIDEGECKDCNDENNSKNWVYNKELDNQDETGKTEPKITDYIAHEDEEDETWFQIEYNGSIFEGYLPKKK